MENNILAQAVNSAVDEKPAIKDDLEALIFSSYKKFIELRLQDFPRMCEVAMMQNKIAFDNLKDNGYQAKFTGSHGWSKDKTFRFEFVIPSDLYIFMKNLVYKDFWSKDNEKISRSFMNAICRGDDPMQTLMKVKVIYGPNSDLSLIT